MDELPPGYLQRLFEIESSGNRYRIKGSYRGLGQFSRELERKYGITDWTDPVQQVRAVAREVAEQPKALVNARSTRSRPARSGFSNLPASLFLTNNATSLILSGNVNIPTAAGDVAVFRSEGSGNWRCVNYTHAGGSPTGSVTTHGDSAYSILATDYILATNAAFTASRTWTLPAANSLTAGQTLTIADEANSITSTNTLVVSRSGSDTIVAQGTTVTAITLASAGALITLISDGSSKWIVQNLRQAPQVSVFTSGTSQTYTTPVGALYLRVRMVGGGGGGGAQATNSGSNGGDTSFGSWTAIHGNGGGHGNAAGGAGGTGGGNGTGTVIARIDGADGQGAQSTNVTGANIPGGMGGSSPFGGAGAGGKPCKLLVSCGPTSVRLTATLLPVTLLPAIYMKNEP